MQLLFKGQQNDFSDECQRAALDAAVLEAIRDLRKQRVQEGLVAMKEEQLAVNLYESAMAGANEREAQAQAEYKARQDYAAEAMREAILLPVSDIAAHGEKLDRMQKAIDFLRGSVSYGRQIEVPNRLVELTRKQSVLADAHADESYLAAVELLQNGGTPTRSSNVSIWAYSDGMTSPQLVRAPGATMTSSCFARSRLPRQ